MGNKARPIGLDEQQAQDLYEKVERIILRDNPYILIAPFKTVGSYQFHWS